MKFYNLLFLIMFFFGYSNITNAQNVSAADKSRAQGDMHGRMFEEWNNYVKKIKIDSTYISYCQQELILHTYSYPKDGHYHFGVNYNEVKDKKQLDMIIASRESYETKYVLLCLANIKNTFKNAEKL
jgi:hypothetical protein